MDNSLTLATIAYDVSVLSQADALEQQCGCIHLISGFRLQFRNLQYVSVFTVGLFCRKSLTGMPFVSQKIVNVAFPADGVIQIVLGFSIEE